MMDADGRAVTTNTHGVLRDMKKRILHLAFLAGKDSGEKRAKRREPSKRNLFLL